MKGAHEKSKEVSGQVKNVTFVVGRKINTPTETRRGEKRETERSGDP